MVPFALSILPIGYLRLIDLTISLNRQQPVYHSPYVETRVEPTQAQRIDQHYIVVSQPDEFNRVHYCRIPVVKLAYFNGVAFATDYAEQLAQVEERHAEIEAWLVGEGYQLNLPTLKGWGFSLQRDALPESSLTSPPRAY